MLRKASLCSGWELSSRRWLAAEKLGTSRLEWLPATVPGHVHGDLMRHRVIQDPFEGLGELGCQWVDEEDWSYRRTFSFEPDAELPRRVLVFEGLDTVCTVRLNGERLAAHDNMFVPLEVDVTQRLRPGENELRVDFESAPRVGRDRRARYFEREGLDAGLRQFDERAFVRKAQYMYGWDWGPRLVSSGIWRPVTLIECSARLGAVSLRQVHRSDGVVELSCSADHDGPGRVVHFVDGFDRPLENGEPLAIERPELWWPAGFGEQRLYTVTSFVCSSAPRRRSDAETGALDRRRTRTGLRTLRLLRNADQFGESFEFCVNGRPFWATGANWIPDHSLPGLVTREHVRAQVERARDMNMNMLRVWGGGLYESDDFYDACDELGVLVWQDFPYACSYYPDDEASLRIAEWEARHAVRRLSPHPSLALWCGNNENLTMFESKWQGASHHPPRYYGRAIFETTLAEIVAELDVERPYVPTSPGGSEPANAGGFGDQHYWDVWHGRGDWVHYRDSTARFSSEFGFASAPGPRAWRRCLPRVKDPLSLDVRERAARFHDKTAKGYDTFVGYVELHYPRAANLRDWTYYSQLNQRDALRFAVEHYRRSEFCRGALLWQLNDCWPAQSWAVLDSEGEYKAAAFELRRLYAPLLLSLEKLEGRAKLWIVLDNATEGVAGEAVLEARSLSDGRVLESMSRRVEVRPGERRVVLDIDVSACEVSDTLLRASLAGAGAIALLAEPKHAALAEPRLRAWRDARGLVVEADVPVVDLYVWDESGELVLDDNFVTLAAAGSVRLRARGPATRLRARSLRGEHVVDVV
jgi:beta-mannosidase